MIGKFSLVTKGKFLEYVDSALANPTEAMLTDHEQVVGELGALGTKLHTIPSGQINVDHTNQEFLGDDPVKSFFPPGGDIPHAAGKRAILISAYIQALRVALYTNPDAPKNKRVKRAKALPIESYWVIGGRYFEMYVSLSRKETAVHVMLLTPFPENVPPAPRGGREQNLWAIATDDRIKVLHDAMPDMYKPPAPFTIHGAQCQKLKGY